jgi:hypothetical protein
MAAATYPTHTPLPRQDEAVCVARCPSCGRHSVFVYGGEQRWPAKVAIAAGIPPVIGLWHCSKCQSTISENHLIV